MSFVNQSDFVGKFKIASNKYSDVTPYIERYEVAIFNELMGEVLATDFLSNPNLPKWDDFKAIGFGVTSLIVGLIYFEFARDLPYRMTNKGFVYQLDENASQVITSYALRQRYNECIDDWHKMQSYLSSNYEEFNGIKRKYITD
jgi:hypothetical protein